MEVLFVCVLYIHTPYICDKAIVKAVLPQLTDWASHGKFSLRGDPVKSYVFVRVHVLRMCMYVLIY